MAEFVVCKDKVNQYRWRFIADNGRLLLIQEKGILIEAIAYMA